MSTLSSRVIVAAEFLHVILNNELTGDKSEDGFTMKRIINIWDDTYEEKKSHVSIKHI